MFLRALTAFLILPGIAAFALPLLIVTFDPWRGGTFYPGLAVAFAGLALLLWCVRDFYVSGKGTLAPWDPPKHLVVAGLYRYTRNPMYVGVLTLVAGWALLFTSPLLALYTIILAIAFHVRVVVHEEPWLAGQFGEEWEQYRSTVNRWLPVSDKNVNKAAARICLIVYIVIFLASTTMLSAAGGLVPVYGVLIILALVTTVTGAQKMRVIGIICLVLSIVLTFQEYQRGVERKKMLELLNSPEHHFPNNVNSIQAIDASDGISRSEAIVIAENYFLSQISGCGYAAEPTVAGDSWESKTYIGIAGKPGPPIYINRNDGGISWKAGEQTMTLQELVQALNSPPK